MRSPYQDLPPRRFWRTGVAETHPLATGDLYRKKFPIGASDRVVTAGSCFAQHISGHLRTNGFTVLDYEPPPAELSAETAQTFGYGLYSARYGNIYAVRQLLQLAEDAFEGRVDPADIWTKDGRYYDALRPSVEPDGFESLEEAIELRREHLKIVEKLFSDMTLFVFTFGLTEAWVHRRTGRVYATAPGTIAGDYDPAIHAFANFSHGQILSDFIAFYDLVKGRNPHVKMLLTVSPVPLTATASDQHVLTATTYSKSVLRAVAGELCDTYSDIDYFPSYEIIASPWSRGFHYESNLRSVSAGGVNLVMQTFFGEHHPLAAQPESEPPSADSKAERRAQRRAKRAAAKGGRQKEATAAEDAVCEEVLLDAFSP